MKKFLYLTTILVLCMSIATPVVAQDNGPVPDQPGELQPRVYLPAVMLMMPSYTVAGQVKDAQDIPLSGVTVKDISGRTVTTNINGQYSMVVTGGNQKLSPSKAGYNFDPVIAQVKINQNLAGQNFTAVAACDAPILNPSFEVVPYYWNPISGNANGYTPYYTAVRANTGSYSGFTGIPQGQLNLVSWSRFRTHEITIPLTATSADVNLFLWPQSSEVIVKAEQKMPDVVGFNTESPDAPVLAGDAQYVAAIDTANNVLAWLVWDHRNDQAWISYGPLSLLPWAGSTIKLEIGTYNDGAGGGVSSAYVDDVNVSVCPGGAVSPGCSNLLLNSNFEAATDWVIKTATYPSAYTTEFVYSGLQSMRSGISLSIPNPFPNIWTTSEFYQPVTIPADAYLAQLRVRLLPRSAEWYAADAPVVAESSNTYDPEALAAAEAQYGFIMDTTGLNTRVMLFKWYHENSAYWLYRQFDLTKFRGQAISVLFGAANDGWNGNTALYVDDVYLEVCR